MLKLGNLDVHCVQTPIRGLQTGQFTSRMWFGEKTSAVKDAPTF